MIISTSEGEMPTLFWGMIVGLPMLGIGGVLCLMGFRKEITRYVKMKPYLSLTKRGGDHPDYRRDGKCRQKRRRKYLPELR